MGVLVSGDLKIYVVVLIRWQRCRTRLPTPCSRNGENGMMMFSPEPRIPLTANNPRLKRQCNDALARHTTFVMDGQGRSGADTERSGMVIFYLFIAFVGAILAAII